MAVTLSRAPACNVACTSASTHCCASPSPRIASSCASFSSRVRPSEHYPFWEEYAKGFTHTFRDLVATDASPLQVRQLRTAFGRILTPGRPRLVLKITGWPRIGFLRQVFPDARFLHIVRDGRAVASSMLAVPFWKGWEGPERWGFGPLSAEHQQIWERYDRSFHALAALEWNLLLDAMKQASGGLAADHFMEVRYEDVCADTSAAMQDIARFAGIDWLPGFERALAAHTVESANDKWRQDLTAEQQRIISEIEQPWLAHYGYAAAAAVTR